VGQQHLAGHAVVDERQVAAEQFPRAGLKTQNPVLHEAKHRQRGEGLGTAGWLLMRDGAESLAMTLQGLLDLLQEMPQRCPK